MTFELTEPDNRASRLRQEFRQRPGLSLTSCAEKLVDETDLYGEESHRSAIVGKAVRELRDALKSKDSHGLPYAGPTVQKDDRGAPVWAVRQLWLALDYDEAFTDSEDTEDEGYALKTRYADECVQRFGRMPQRTRPRRHRDEDPDPIAA